jgi:hypothetical protein
LEDIIIEERQIPERRETLRRKVTVRTQTGIRKDEGIPFCHYCGQMIPEDAIVSIFVSCCSFLDVDCRLVVFGRIMCIDCAKTKIDLSIGAMKALVAIACEPGNYELRSQLAMNENEFSSAIRELKAKGLAEGKFLAFIFGYKPTSQGRDVLTICSEILRKEGRLF